MANTSVKVELKPIVRIRVRCAEAHTDPWLRRLYVVWAAIPPGESETTPGESDPETGEDRNPGIPALYAVAQSDEKGNLSPVMNGLDPATDATVTLFPDVDYQFYFVRHPAAQFAHDIASALNADPEGAKKRYGEARKLRAILTQTGVDKKKKPILEGVISLQEDPAWFVQNGSPHYGGWALFRNMPGTGSNKVDTDIQCRPLFDHVRRLQFQLGRLRYPIGNQWHPYSPEPWTSDATRKKQKAKLPGLLYPNEGVNDRGRKRGRTIRLTYGSLGIPWDMGDERARWYFRLR